MLKEAKMAAFNSDWEKLSKIEKYVMCDLSKDGFVNYRNKDILISLMQKGEVVSDPSSGRIRLKSYAFRQFILDWIESNPTFFDEEKSENVASSWARWQLPALIVGATLCIFIFYVNSDSNSQIISIGGGIIGAITLVLKFINTFQSMLPKSK